MKIIERDGLIYLPITLKYDSKVYKINDCILDTGFAGTVIDIDFIQFNPKIPAVLKRLHGIGGHQDVVAQNVDFIKIDSIYLRNVLIEFGDINNSFGIKGILGTNLLKYMDFHLSFINKTIEFKNINV
jgi:hypothetical protein